MAHQNSIRTEHSAGESKTPTYSVRQVIEALWDEISRKNRRLGVCEPTRHDHLSVMLLQNALTNLSLGNTNPVKASDPSKERPIHQ